jgi:replicative DNA helicase
MGDATFFDHGLEQAVLGAVIASPELRAMASVLSPGDFHEPAHGEVLRAVRSLEQNQQPVTVALLRAEIRRVDRLNTTETVCNIHAIARTKLDRNQFLACLNRVISFSTARRAYLTAKAVLDVPKGISSEAYVERCRRAFEGAVSSRVCAGETSMLEAVEEFDQLLTQVTSGQGPTAVSTGLHDLDWRLAGGFRPGQLWVLAARPGVGKTALALQIAVKAALRGQPVAFFSLEMLRVELTQRACCDWGSVDWEQVKLGRHTDDDLRALLEAQQALSVIPLSIFDQSGQRAADVRAICARLTSRPALVVVDYLQLLKLDNAYVNRSDGIGASAATLKALAKELGCPVLALAQFNRSAENRPSKRPQLSDLRGSGEIEQHADGVLILHREELYKPDDAAVRGLAEVFVAKNRSGSTGKVKLAFQREFTRFRDLEAEDNVVPMRRPEPDPYLDTPHWQEEA